MKTAGLIGILTICAAATAGAQQKAGQQQPEIPAEYRPPKGMCRIWLKDVPPAQQPASTDCASAVKNCPPNARVIFGDTQETRNKPKADPKDLPDTRALTGKPGAVKPPIILRKPPTE
jgi:hypothetical protein